MLMRSVIGAPLCFEMLFLSSLYRKNAAAWSLVVAAEARICPYLMTSAVRESYDRVEVLNVALA